MSLAALANSATLNLVQGQLAPNGVRSDAVLDAFLAIDRSLYLPPVMKSFAYIDDNVVDGAHGVFMLRPVTLALMLQYLTQTLPLNAKVGVVNDTSHYVCDLLTELGYQAHVIADEGHLAGQKWEAIILNGAVADMSLSAKLCDLSQPLFLGIEQASGQGIGNIVALQAGERIVLGQAGAPYINGLAPKAAFSL